MHVADNFYLDNPDLVRMFSVLDLSEVVEILENGYAYHADFQRYPDSPRSYADAVDSFRRLLTLLGEICATRVAPRAAEAAEEGAHLVDGRVEYAAATRDALQALRQAELMGALLPREYGGLNLPETVYQMMVELVSRAEAGLMTVFGLQEISETISDVAEPELKDRLLPRFTRGEVTAAMVLTEPDAGSDLGAVQTRGWYDEAAATWRLRGVKRFITNGSADVLLVLARTEEGSTDARGLSLFAVEKDPSVLIRRLENKMGLRASPTCEIQFEDTPARLLGKQRFGLIRYAMGMMNGARLAVAAQALGIAEAAYREARDYARKRVQFGQSVDQLPPVYRMLLGMRCDIEATRSLLYEAAYWVDLKRALERRKDLGLAKPDDRERLKQADRLTSALTPLVKYHATEMGNRVCSQAVQVHGGAGYMREYAVERHFRDVRVTSIYEGTSQLQVVAALGPLMGGALDERLAAWGSGGYGSDLEDLERRARQATSSFQACVRSLADKDRPIIDYYGSDLVELASHVLTCWLVLRDAGTDPRKAELARTYFGMVEPKMRGSSRALEVLDPTPLVAREAVLGP
jgi:alkylation response protein AidB-like acyl-CoA dehydrogenase